MVNKTCSNASNGKVTIHGDVREGEGWYKPLMNIFASGVEDGGVRGEGIVRASGRLGGQQVRRCTIRSSRVQVGYVDRVGTDRPKTGKQVAW
jgi:hypothetical protein